MEDPGSPLDLASKVIRWALAIGAGLVAFLLWRWLVGPSLHWVETIIGCVLFAGVALAVLRVTERSWLR